jgi:tRNA threonylcarbamoyladenosine biosynthesis protein TsaE
VATFISKSAAETEAFGRDFGGRAEPNDVLALCGDLGAGKTQFVKGFVAGTGSPTAATSPTFTLVHEYPGGRVPVYHFDFFRLEGESAAERLGLDDYLNAGGVCLIEWADKLPELIPPRAKWIVFETISETERKIVIQGAAPFDADGGLEDAAP